MRQDTYDLIIVGAGPAGLSAAARAQENGLNTLVLEQGELANTFVQEYQNGKYVMDLPAILPLRSDVEFKAGSRESILQTWDENREAFKLNLLTHVSVRSIEKTNGVFEVKTQGGDAYTATYVVLAIGKLGNPRKLNAPGDTLPHVQYRLRDPNAYHGQDILVVGAGDSAAEVALALSDHNRVSIVNRKAELYRMNESLRNQIEQKCDRDEMTLFSSADVKLVEDGSATLSLPTGDTVVKADHIFVKIGAEVPRRFLESCGVAFPSDSPSALPEISDTYQTNVPGLYLIGSVTGKDLVKHAMNQGWEVVEHILGREVTPVDEDLLRERLRAVRGDSVQDKLDYMATSVPLLGLLSTQRLRELSLVASVHDVKPGQVIFREHDYSTTIYAIVDGQVIATFGWDTKSHVEQDQGGIFGELSLLSDRRRSGTITAAERSTLVEIPRHFMLRLMNTEPAVKQMIDDLFMKRATQAFLGVLMSDDEAQKLTQDAEFKTFNKDETIYKEGDEEEAIYLIRSGSVKVSRNAVDGTEHVITYLPSGSYFGEAALLDETRDVRSATATAAMRTEVISILKADFLRFLQVNPHLKEALNQKAGRQSLGAAMMALAAPKPEFLDGFIEHGVVESTDVLLIDETKCIRCDNCVNACAGTHQGQSRLDRVAGPSFDQIHVPVACRHCEGAPCLQDCPPGDAIVRAPNGVVMIYEDRCIGCGNCARFCPYGVIKMVEPPEKKSFWNRFNILDLLRSKNQTEADGHREVAIKCDLCASIDVDHDMANPACVQSCPTGAAIRVSPDYFNEVQFR